MASTSARILKTRVVFKGPGRQVNGLEAVPEGLWLSDQQDYRTYLVDYDGKPTRWGHFDPETLNRSRYSWGDRGLNSLSILSYLAVAGHMTGDPKYSVSAEKLVREGHYDINLMAPKTQTGMGSGNQSDDEMAMMNYYTLLRYEKDPELRQRYAFSLANYWDLERPEMNPFFNFVAAAGLKGASYTDAYRTYDLTLSGNWLEESIDTLRRWIGDGEGVRQGLRARGRQGGRG